jgi:hypothetical protein
MMTSPTFSRHIESWLIHRLVEYPRNPRKNDGAVDRMCGSIREFGFKIPVILCDEWSPAQVKAFRLMVNRSVTWADWDETLLSEELLSLKDLDFDLGLTGFEDEELARLLAAQDVAEGLTDEDAIPDLPQTLCL